MDMLLFRASQVALVVQNPLVNARDIDMWV